MIMSFLQVLTNHRVGTWDESASCSTIRKTMSSTTLGNSSIEISVSCRNLIHKKNDLLRPDLTFIICIIYEKSEVDNEWVELQQTERIANNLNPDFGTKVKVEYVFEKSQMLRFQLYRINSLMTMSISDQDTIGYVECTVGKIVASGPRGLVQELQSLDPLDTTQSNGTITLIAKQLTGFQDWVLLQLCGTSVGSWTTSCFNVESFYDVSKLTDIGTYVVVGRCVDAPETNPLWSSLRIPGRTLCCGDYDRPIRIQVFRKRMRKGKPKLIGFCVTTVNRLMHLSGTDDWISLQSTSGKKSRTSIVVQSCSLYPMY